MLITKQWIHEHKSRRGGWTKRQLNALGLRWQPSKGWIDELTGTSISEEQRKKFEMAKKK